MVTKELPAEVSNMSKEKKIHLGTVGVDSGTLMITDPCYVVGDDWNETHYERYVVKGETMGSVLVKLNTPPMNIGGEKNKKFKGHHVIFPSGLGDGVYDVYAYRRKLGKFGERTTKVEIVMISDEEAAEYEKN